MSSQINNTNHLTLTTMAKKSFTAKGYVLGNYWGGGSGAYPTIKFQASTAKKIQSDIEKAFKDGSIDSGMGYESLKGAILEVTQTTTIVRNGKEFTIDETQQFQVGKLFNDEVEFLENCF